MLIGRSDFFSLSSQLCMTHIIHHPLSLLNFLPNLFFSYISSLFCSHIRWGAPPVINPIGLVFPSATQWSPCLSLTLPVTSHSSTTFNLANPAPGDWYIAAHLPEDDGRIEQKVCIELYTILYMHDALFYYRCCDQCFFLAALCSLN